jgi:hypothetical protein
LNVCIGCLQKAINRTISNEQEKAIEFVCLYASDFSNNEIVIDQRILSHKDNKQILADNPKLKSFADAKNVKERYRVWNNQKIINESGLKKQGIMQKYL